MVSGFLRLVQPPGPRQLSSLHDSCSSERSGEPLRSWETFCTEGGSRGIIAFRRRTDFHGSKLNGAYFIKAITYQANFEGADASDVLWDRSVIVEAKLRNAQLQVRHLCLLRLTPSVTGPGSRRNDDGASQSRTLVCSALASASPRSCLMHWTRVEVG